MATALVLSAGGMFGAWQAGAWRALAGRVTIDMVVGASAGALNGWAIAGGMAPDDLIAAWLERDTADLIRPRFPAPTFFDPAPLYRLARDLFERYPPRLQFATTLAEVPRLRPRVVRGPEMTWRHLAASCSIPAGFPSMKLDGRRYVDGGLLGALPLWAAAELGATRAVALDALPMMPSRILRAGSRLIRRLAVPVPPVVGLEVLRIRPSEKLGGVSDAVLWSRDRALRWIELGEHDAKLFITI